VKGRGKKEGDTNRSGFLPAKIPEPLGEAEGKKKETRRSYELSAFEKMTWQALAPPTEKKYPGLKRSGEARL